MKVIDLLNTYLRYFNVENNIFKAIIGDKDAIPNSIIENSSDYNTGAIANELELLSQYTDDEILQLNINYAISDSGILTLLSEYYNLPILPNFTDEDYRVFVKDIIMGHKGTKHNIIRALIPWTFSLPVVLEGCYDGMFYVDGDIPGGTENGSYYDYFWSFKPLPIDKLEDLKVGFLTDAGGVPFVGTFFFEGDVYFIDNFTNIVKAAIYRDYPGVFYFEVYLTGIEPDNLKDGAFTSIKRIPPTGTYIRSGYYLVDAAIKPETTGGYGDSFLIDVSASPFGGLFIIDIIDRTRIAATIYNVYVL